MIWLKVNTKLSLKKTESNKGLRKKAFKIASNPNYDGYQRRLASMVYTFFHKNLQAVVLPRLLINLFQID